MVLHVLFCRWAHNYLGSIDLLPTPPGPNSCKGLRRKAAFHCRIEDENEQFWCAKYAFQNGPGRRAVDGYEILAYLLLCILRHVC